MIERYTRPEMGKIWTPENRYQAWRDGRMRGVEPSAKFPMPTWKRPQGSRFTVDRAVDRANEIEEPPVTTSSPPDRQPKPAVGPPRFIHLGCIASDIVDTAGSLLMVEAGELISRRSTASSPCSRR